MFNMTLLYMNRNIPLQAKILFGYMMLMAVIISMAAILFHEHARLRKIEPTPTKSDRHAVTYPRYTATSRYSPHWARASSLGRMRTTMPTKRDG